MLRSLPFAVACVVTVSSTAFAADTPKWQGHTELEGKWGTERSLGEMGVFIPVWQDGDTLLAADIRQRIDDANSQEGNYGLSLRQLFAEQDVILGGYAFFDRRRTPNANVFNQATLGAEALWRDYEARLNVYIPESTEETLSAGSTSAAIVGSSIQVQSFSGTTERALPGFDAELGAKFDLSDEWKLWLYGGGFYFDSDGYDTVAGPRARLEISRGNLPMFGQGSRLTLGLEAQHDNVRGDQAFAIARIRVPFAAFGGQGQADDLSALEQRMTGRIYRDIDIVSGESAPQLVSSEAGMFELDNGTKVSSFTTIDATGDIDADVTAAGNNALVVIDGSKGTINTPDLIFAQAGQTLIGGGASISVAGASGATATLTLPGSRPTINSTYLVGINGSISFVGDDVTVQNMTITAARVGVEVNNDDRITLRDLVIRDTGNDSIQIVSSDDVLIENVRVYRPAGGGQEAIQFGNGGFNTQNNITIKDFYAEDVNVGILMAGGATTNGLSLDNVTINHTGNVLETQNGAPDGTLNNPSGAITATNVSGANCVNNGIITGSALTINGVACP